jgi:hypothetical protein
VADGEDACEKDEKSLERAFGQIKHALLTSLDVVIKESGLDLDETVGPHVQTLIDGEHTDLGDGL